MSDQTRFLPEAQPSEPENSQPSILLVIFLIVPLLGILAALVMVASDLRERSSTTLPPSMNNPVARITYTAPDFTLQMLDGASVSLSDFRGRILLLNFWQTTCVPCVVELPEFVDFIADQNPDEVALLAVNVGETQEQIQSFFAEHEIAGVPVALDSDSALTARFGVQGIPVTFIITPEGVIRFMNVGSMTYDEMEEYIAMVRTTDPTVVK